MTDRLSSTARLPSSVATPSYDRASRKSGIVHIGTGAFHKAHQAAATDDALAASGGDWMITGVSLRSTDIADAMNPQDGLYTLIVRGPDGVFPRVIGSIREVIAATRHPDGVMAALTAPETKIVSTTITEKGYGINPGTGGLDPTHASVKDDLANPSNPKGAVGFIVEALERRRRAGVPAFTVLCCDNLPNNGRVLGRLVREFAARRDPSLAEWIAANVTFPSTMVDRITPPSTPQTYEDVKRLTGFEDRAAVETEPFTQWVIEDDFVAGRPAWEAGGAIFAENVAPYEKMKLRLLNGSHSLLAYSGFMAGLRYVRDVMEDADLVAIIARHMREASKTLDPVPGVDLEAYAKDLRDRFANPAIGYETYQIAMDGTQKLPQRLLEPALHALQNGLPLDSYAFAVAAWMRYAMARKEDGAAYALRDPREAEIAAALDGQSDASDIVARLLALPGLFPAPLAESNDWRTALTQRLGVMLDGSMRAAIGQEAERCRG